MENKITTIHIGRFPHGDKEKAKKLFNGVKYAIVVGTGYEGSRLQDLLDHNPFLQLHMRKAPVLNPRYINGVEYHYMHMLEFAVISMKDE